MRSCAPEIHLGRDRTRMRDPRDAARQHATADAILQRYFHEDDGKRWQLQVLADEVGMGKTFVALAVAYSMLASMRAGKAPADLQGCLPRVVVIAPPNKALRTKWHREVQELVRRCFHEEDASVARRWFHPVLCERYEDLVNELAKPLVAEPSGEREAPHVIVTHMGALGGGKRLQHYDIKRRVLLGALFRFWGRRMPTEERERLLKGAPEGWPSDPQTLTEVAPEDWAAKLSFPGGLDEMLTCLRRIAESQAEALANLLTQCREIGAPYVRKRDELFSSVSTALNALYAQLCAARMTAGIPLVIVDEAHNWKNGPRQGSNGYEGFRRWVAPFARRALLLTATPFQLRPHEMIEILKVGDHLAPTPSSAENEERRTHLENHREKVIRTALDQSATHSASFAKAWGRLSRETATRLGRTWHEPRLVAARHRLVELAGRSGALTAGDVDRVVMDVLADPDFIDQREILREGLRLHAFNADLSRELGELVVRHRRRTDHRLVQIGAEYEDARLAQTRQDRHVLHAANGIDVRGDAELPHYLLMRCVSEMKGGKGRSSLGTALTGCYSTLLESNEGRGLTKRLASGGAGNVYVELLRQMVDTSKDAEHPKVRVLTEAVVRAFRAGEKTLVFCFRTHTAKRLEDILSRAIEAELSGRAEALGGERALENLRSRITRREGDLVVLGLDRVLWSLAWAASSAEIALPPLDAEKLRLQPDELGAVARLALRHGVDLTSEKVDRVFLNRVHEHVVAQRLRKEPGAQLWKRILAAMCDPSWIEAPYGLSDHADGDDDAHKETGGLDARGIHARYPVVLADPASGDVSYLALQLDLRRRRAVAQEQVSVLDAYVDAPSFWLGTRPESTRAGDPLGNPARTLRALHEHLLRVTRDRVTFDWKDRALTLQALRRAILRSSILLRILPRQSQLDDASWGQLLVDGLLRPLEGQRESLADRLAVFVEDLQAADGHLYNPGDSRHHLYEATRLRGTDSPFVALVNGETAPDTRERIFAGFNSPLMPDVLVCTSVGQEGIDLHRHCRHVVHYDLAWNPAVVEQRTGRVDRIGSKTFRERSVELGGGDAHLSVGVPFLAGTYDERMYEELRLRAQTFEVLTGGDLTPDELEGAEDGENPEGEPRDDGYPTLPDEMIDDLRVRLHVWDDVAAAE